MAVKFLSDIDVLGSHNLTIQDIPDLSSVYQVAGNYLDQTSADARYLRLSGGTLTGVLNVQNAIQVSDATFVDSARGSIRLNSSNVGAGNGIFFRDGFNYNASITVEDHNGSYPDGICISGYDGISFSTGANDKNERMRITTAGKVGIGTTNPTTIFHAVGALNDGWGIFQRGTKQLYVNPNYSGTNVFAQLAPRNGDSMDLSLAGNDSRTDDIYIKHDTGNVGIGTTTPYSLLQVGHTEQTTAAELTIASRYGSSAPILNFRSGHANNDNVWNMARIVATDDGNYNGRLEFRTTVNSGYTGTQPQTRMVIKATGYVGIGTTTPTEKLTVAGNILAGGSVHIDNRGDYVTFYGNNSGDHSITSRNVAGGADDDIRINSYGNVLVNLDSNANNTDAAFVIGRHGSASGTMNSTDILRVGEDGKVSIGKSSAVNSKMVIKGDGSYVGDYGYCTLTLEEGSGYPGLNFRQDSNNWLVRKVASGASSHANAMQFVFSSDASAPGTGSYSKILQLNANGSASFEGNLSVAGNVTGANLSISDWNTAYGWGNHADAGYLKSVTNISGYSGTLLRSDNRTISPSEETAGRMKFGFTSWNNNNSGPWADFLHLRSYTDSSGGNDNLVSFLKEGIEMRIWQNAYGSADPYSDFRDVAFKDEIPTNTNQLTNGAGFYSGTINLYNNDLIMQGSDPGDIVWRDAAGNETHRLWAGSTSNLTFRSNAGTAHVVYHAGNLNIGTLDGYTQNEVDTLIDEAPYLSTSGGTMTGTLRLPWKWNSTDITDNSFYVQRNSTEDGFAFGIGTGVSTWFSWDGSVGTKRAIDVWNDGSKILLGAGGHDTEISNNLYVPNHIFHTNDTDTYMQFHAANQWRVVTGGAERLEVNDTDVTVQNDFKVYGSYTEVGNGIGSVSNDANWNARLNVAGTQHARLDVVSVSDGIVTTTYSHTGQGMGKMGTISNHPLGLMTAGGQKVMLGTGGNMYPVNDRTQLLGLDSNRWQIVFCEILDSAGQHEKNLQNPEGEKSVGEYQTGTVLVWKGGKNIPCTEYADHMRMGIAVEGIDSPLIQGAEPVLVTGPVNEGDYLVTSRKEGHAEAMSPEVMRQQNLFDCVIGKALESGDGESYLIKTWINI